MLQHLKNKKVNTRTTKLILFQFFKNNQNHAKINQQGRRNNAHFMEA